MNKSIARQIVDFALRHQLNETVIIKTASQQALEINLLHDRLKCTFLDQSFVLIGPDTIVAKDHLNAA